MSNSTPMNPAAPPPSPAARAANVPVPPDSFASAKANLRDTVKWLATTFAGVAAVMLAGTSLTGLSLLKGFPFAAALFGGALGLLCFIAASGLMLRLLTSKTFFFSDISTPEYSDLKAVLNAHAVDILPAEIRSVDDMLKLRLEATEQARQYASAPQSASYQSASGFLASIVDPLSRLTSLAHFEILRADLNAAVPKLFVLAMGAVVGLGVFAVYSGNSKVEKQAKPAVSDNVTSCKLDSCEEGPIVELATGTGWSNVGSQFAAICGDKAPIKVQLLGTSQSGWVKVRLLSPDSCAGVVLPLPTATVIPSAAHSP
jgi:hypothetical protein